MKRGTHDPGRGDEMKSGKVLWFAVLAATFALLSSMVVAQGTWPTRPVRLVVPFAPGGSNDIIARVLAERLTARTGQSFVVENKAGAGGTIGTDFVAKAPPDGYTLLFVSTSITTNAASGKTLPYDLLNDLQPIGQVAAGPFAIVVANDLPARTLKEFIDLARAKPGSVSYGSAGIGGINQLGTELFASAAKIQLVHIPYKGIGPAFTDQMAGRLQMTLPTVASVVTYLQAGKMRGLAVTSAQRSPLAPDLPTVSEVGLPGFELEVWWGIVGPAKMPPALVKRINEELNAVLTAPEVRDVLVKEGASPRPGSPEAFGELIASDLKRWTKLIKDAKIQVE
ncbi:MAG: tripartite tricarboxylate transporter substrate binding protein [Burkholderiales bacterium]